MRRRDLDARMTAVEETLDKVDRNMERIEIVTMVREPNTGIAADAYDGLRKQVIASAGERVAHLHQLAQFDSAVRAGASMEQLGALVREWMGQASLLVVEDADLADAFDFVGPEDATGVRVSRPAYVDSVTGRIVRKGVAERVEEVDARDASGGESRAVDDQDGGDSEPRDDRNAGRRDASAVDDHSGDDRGPSARVAANDSGGRG